MFIGRSEELGLLEKLYAKNSLNVVLVSGEYKIGKTVLLQEFLQKKICCLFCCPQCVVNCKFGGFLPGIKRAGPLGSKK